MDKIRFASGPRSLQYKAERLGWSGSLLLQTEAALIDNYSREQTNYRCVLYMTPLQNTQTIPLNIYKPILFSTCPSLQCLGGGARPLSECSISVPVSLRPPLTKNSIVCSDWSALTGLCRPHLPHAHICSAGVFATSSMLETSWRTLTVSL